MAGKKGNIFGEYVDQRKQAQEKIEAAVTGNKRPSSGRVRKRGADATTITLSISREDKDRVREIAEREGASISDLLHQWIRKAYEE